MHAAKTALAWSVYNIRAAGGRTSDCERLVADWSGRTDQRSTRIPVAMG